MVTSIGHNTSQLPHTQITRVRPLSRMQKIAIFIFRKIASCSPSIAIFLASRFDVRSLVNVSVGFKNETADQITLLFRGVTLAKLNTQNKLGQTPLMLAIHEGRYHEANWLIDAGADVNLQDNNGNTAYRYACDQRNQTIALKLQANKADLNIKNNDNQSGYDLAELHSIKLATSSRGMLTQAILSRDEATINGLVNFRADPSILDCQDHDGKTPLIHAVLQMDYNTVKALVNAQANLRVKDLSGRTALDWAATSGRLHIVKFLIQTGAYTLQDLNHALSTAITAISPGYEGPSEVVGFLIQRGADIDQKDQNGKTAFMRAVEAGDHQKAQLLVKFGAKVDEQDHMGRNAVEKGGPKMALLLRSSGAKVDAQDHMGRTALMHAVETGDEKMTRLFKHWGARDDIEDRNGMTAALLKEMPPLEGISEEEVREQFPL